MSWKDRILAQLRSCLRPLRAALMVACALSAVAAFAFERSARPPETGADPRTQFMAARTDAPPPRGTEATPRAPAFGPEVMGSINRVLQEEIRRGAFPGAALALGVGTRIVETAGVGAIGWTRNAPSVDPEHTLYDLASVTKVVATTGAVMLLLEDGRLALDDSVFRHLPAFSGAGKERVTIRHLLTHTSGLPPGMRIRGRTRAERVRHVIEHSRVYASPGTEVEYSDLNFVVLYEVLRRAAREPLPQFLERRLFRPLGMTQTRYSPGLECESCAPTGRLRDQRLYRGKPFDPIGQQLDGITGSSGLFSSAHDLARFAAMIAGEGSLDGVQILRPETVREFLRPQPLPGRRLLGWEVFCQEGPRPDREACERPYAIGHTGYTGTSLWIHSETDTWAVLLTNRTYEPKAEEQIDRVRRELFKIAIGAVPLAEASGAE